MGKARSVTYLYSLNGNTRNVKIVMLLPHYHLTWNLQYIERQTKKEMNHSLAPISGSCQHSYSLRPDWVGQPVGSWLPSKSEKLWYASPLRQTTQSRSFSEFLTCDMILKVCASLRGLYASVATHCTCTANHSHTGSHSHFLASLLLFIFHFYLQPLSLMSPLKVLPWRQTKNTAINTSIDRVKWLCIAVKEISTDGSD